LFGFCLVFRSLGQALRRTAESADCSRFALEVGPGRPSQNQRKIRKTGRSAAVHFMNQFRP
jgi:hypothetical protein